MLGTATNNATVTVNNQPTYRKGDYWHRELSVDNSSALWLGVTNIAVQSDGINPDKVTNIVGNIFVSPATETITHDADGNITSDGRWEMQWDAENRLTNITSSASTPLASKRKVEYAYDYQGRMLRRTAYDGSSGSYVLTEDLKYVYDGWRCMAEINCYELNCRHNFGRSGVIGFLGRCPDWHLILWPNSRAEVIAL